MLINSHISKSTAMISDFLSLIFPETCNSCLTHLYKNERVLCFRCRSNLPKTGYHFTSENPLASRLWGRVPIKHAFAFLHYRKGGLAQKILYKIKYEGYTEGCKEMGIWYGHDLKKSGLEKEFDLIVPVPLHAKKQKRRGFNQSELFAEGLSETLEIEMRKDILLRVADRKSQTNKGKLDRWKNVSDVYVLNQEVDVNGKRILIADDVVTTGATIEACAQQLLNGGAEVVSVAAFACA